MRKSGSARRLPTPWIILLLLVRTGGDRVAGGPRLAAARAKVETWRQEGPSAFAKSHRESVVISDNGRVRLGHAVSPVGYARRRPGSGTWPGPATARCWRRPAMPARSSAATRSRTAPGPCSTTRPTRRCSRWSSCPDGTIFAGTGPNGQVVNLTDPKHPTSRPDPKVQYIWDLAADPQGNVYAATGPDRPALEARARGPMVAALRQQVDPPALRRRRPGRDDLCRRRRRGPDLPGRARRQGHDPLRRPAVRDPHPAGGRRRHALRRDRGRGRRIGRLAELAVPHASRIRRTRPDRGRSRSGASRRPAMRTPWSMRAAQAPRGPARFLGEAGPSVGRAVGGARSRSRPGIMRSTGSTPTASRARCSGSRR